MFSLFIRVVLILIFVYPIQAVPAEDGKTTIVVAGKGALKVKPDVASIWMGVEKSAKTAEEAQTLAIQIMDDILASLEKIKIPKDAIETAHLSLRPEYTYDKGKRNYIGYVARNMIKVTTEKLEELGKIIDVSIGAGATNIDRIVFSVKDRAPYEKLALEKAFDNARTKAEIIAKASDLVLIGIERIEEVEARLIPLVRGAQALPAEARVAGPETRVLPGEIEVRGNLTVVFECKRK